MRALTEKEAETLEQILDATSLRQVLKALGSICYAKAAHIAEAWQDRPLAQKWVNVGNFLDRANEKQYVKDVSH